MHERGVGELRSYRLKNCIDPIKNRNSYADQVEGKIRSRSGKVRACIRQLLLPCTMAGKCDNRYAYLFFQKI